MSEPLDLEPIKALLVRRREEIMNGGPPLFPVLDVEALVQEVERLRGWRSHAIEVLRECLVAANEANDAARYYRIQGAIR